MDVPEELALDGILVLGAQLREPGVVSAVQLPIAVKCVQV
jgi:hypothetical protein